MTMNRSSSVQVPVPWCHE